jgi:hypothetical protein
VAGRDAPDFVVLGSRFEPRTAAGADLFGGRARWRGGRGVEAEAGIGIRQGGGESNQVVAAEVQAALGGGLSVEAAAAHDGEGIAGRLDLARRSSSSQIVVSAEHVDHGFLSPDQEHAQLGRSLASLGVVRTFGRGSRLAAGTSWRRLATVLPAIPGAAEPPAVEPAFEEAWSHQLSGDIGLGSTPQRPRLRLLAFERTEGLGEQRQRRRGAQALVRMEERRFLGERLSHRWSGGLVAEELAGLDSSAAASRMTWTALVLEPHLGLGRLAFVTGRLEHRLARSGPAGRPLPRSSTLSIDAGLRLPGRGPLAGGGLRAGYREWETLGGLATPVQSGRLFSAGLDLRSRPLGPFELVLSGTWIEDPDSGFAEGQIEAGVGYRLGGGDRGPALGRGGRVRGTVFHDLDGDGVRAPGEPGLADVAVRLADGREARTGRDGRYRLKLDRPHTSVRVVAESAVARLHPTTPTFASVATGVAATSVDFGLGPAPVVIELLVWNDTDEDGLRGENELLVRGVILQARRPNGETIQARSERTEITELALPSDPNTTLSWRWESVPAGYQALPSALPPVSAEAGARLRAELPLVPLRTVRGQVFVDSDGDRVFDPGERLVAGVVVASGRRRAVSDELGHYVLRGLPAGRVELFVERAPAGLAAGAAVELRLDDTPVSRDDVDVPLRPPVDEAPR